ncbi:MAG: universal stress protein [Rhizobacter sp.]|nr:universal stress protein [Rhizobacter sp.]
MRSLLVHLDASPQCSVRLHVARQLAQRHGARVSALFAVVPGSGDLPSSFSAMALAEAVRANDLDGRHAARTALDKAVALGGPAVDWSETVSEPPLPALARRALFADLLVLGKRNPAGPRTEQLPADFAERVVMHSGRPALVVPDDMPPGDVGQRIVIAWKPSRESAHAVSAALPLLRAARSVQVLMWHDKAAPAPAQPPHDITSLLHAHGIEAELHALGPAPSRIGEAILGEAQRAGADLLVMGCYGRSRAAELVLGGASRSVLQRMPMPVLMAH